MAINQQIESALTLYSSSIANYPLSSPINIITGSVLPSFVGSPWVHKIKTGTQQIASTTQTNITELTATLANSTRYLVYAYILGGSTATTNGFRASLSVTNTTILIWNTETPLTTTSTQIANTSAGAAATSPSSTTTNYYCTILRGIVVTAAAGSPVLNITAASEVTTGGNRVDVGPGSMLVYRSY